MVWVVGIDEAGYGPNLGPLAQAAVAVRLPADDLGGYASVDPWVRRHAVKDAARLLVDDSKLVHTGKYGLQKLEHAVTALLGLTAPTPFGDWLAGLVPSAAHHAELSLEAWYNHHLPLPQFPEPKADLRPTLATAGIEVRPVGLRLVPTPEFNRVLAGSGSKATILAIGLTELIRIADAKLPAGEELLVVADQLGGRGAYAHLLEAAFPTATVGEGVDVGGGATEYRVNGAGRPAVVRVQPEADATYFAVALASILAKYAREQSMRQFNAYWQSHAPGVKATAGYPVDAKRFYDEIAPAMGRLGVEADAVWRRR